MDDDQTRALSFGAVADVYERYRPGYPVEAAAWVLHGAPGGDVLDLAAGTGKLTRAAIGAGARVTAVEPSAQMLAMLRAALPAVPALEGSAERIPLDDDSVDAVLVGQAFHWFDAPRALDEIARVLRPGGVLGLVFNLRDDSVAWVSAMMQIDGGADRRSLVADELWQELEDHPRFGSVQRREFTNPTAFDLDRLSGWARSTSAVSTLPEDERRQTLDRIGQLVADHPDLRGRERFSMPFVTVAGRTVQRAIRTA